MQRAIERPSDFSAQMKATTLSAHAEKFGLSAETRLQLAYHVGGFKMLLFFRPTPLGFRQVVQHVRLHVA